ncbi:MAG: hypothetical protein GXO78_01860 [Calditrichaeota bacterium]|nr:hypothetical protein [Calditrichota bacterium]
MSTVQKVGLGIFLIGIFMGGFQFSCSSWRTLPVGYLQPVASSTAEDEAAIQLLEGWGHPFILSADVNVTRLRRQLHRLPVVWIHIPDSVHYQQWQFSAEWLNALREYYQQGGRLLLTQYAALLPYRMWIETRKPDIHPLRIIDYGYGRKYGFQGFRGHPIFHRLFGGAFVWDATQDHVADRVGYFGGAWPDSARVIGVDKAYVRVFQDTVLAWEYANPAGGRIVVLGGYIYLARENFLKEHLHQLLVNALDYLVDKRATPKPTYWFRDANVPKRFAIQKPLTAPVSLTPAIRLQTIAPELLLERQSGTENFFDVSGRRCLIMGKEKGGLDEVWIHPFRLLRDFRLGIIQEDQILWLDQLPVRIEVRPESFTRYYHTPFGILREVVVAALNAPGGWIQLSGQLKTPVRILVKFRADLRWMWPYRENTLGSVWFAYDSTAAALHIRDKSGDFYGVFGGSMKPLQHLEGAFDDIQWKEGRLMGVPGSENQVYHAAVYAWEGQLDQAFTYAFAGSDLGREDVEKAFRRLREAPAEVYQELVHYYENFLETHTVIRSPDAHFNRGYLWSLVGTDRFWVHTPRLGTALVAGYATTARGWDGGHRINGRPGYAWYFGRDAEWAALAITAYGDFDGVRQQLAFFRKYQDISGKIFHEISTSGVVHFDAADATPLYPILAAHYLRHSGNQAFIRKIWPSLKKAMDFLETTDWNRDGLIDNRHVGHGWIEGGRLYGAQTTLYLAGLWARCLSDMAYLTRTIGHLELAERYQRRADSVIAIIERDFWNPKTQFYYLGKWPDGSYRDDETVLPATLMNFKLLDPDRVGRMLEAYASSAFTADWGVRILSKQSPYFNPRGYHSGSVWPLFTGWAALAEYNYGFSVQGFTHMMENLNGYRHWALGFIEEVLHGEVYQPHGVCPHQCWSETGVLIPALLGMVGFYPDATDRKVLLQPRFPVHWDHVSVDHLRVGKTRFSLQWRWEDHRLQVQFKKDAGPTVTVAFQPEIPPGMTIHTVRVQQKRRDVRWRRDALGLIPEPVTFPLEDSVTVELAFQGGMGVIPWIPQPTPGEPSRGLRILRVDEHPDGLSLALEGVAGRSEQVTFRMFDEMPVRAEGARLIEPPNPRIVRLNVPFTGKKGEYVRKTVRIYWSR